MPLLPVIAQVFDTTVDALVNDEAYTAAVAQNKPGPQKKIQQQTNRDSAHRQAARYCTIDRRDVAGQRITNKPAQCAGLLVHSV